MSPLTEDQIRLIARIAAEELGPVANTERLREVVQRVTESLERQGPRDFRTEPHGRILVVCISLDGLKTSSILSQALKDSGWTISERSERTVAGFHTLTAVADRGESGEDFETLRRRLSDAGNQVGVRIILQTEDALKRGP